MSRIADDMAARWAPSPAQLELAAAAYAADPAVIDVLVGLCHPGKEHGWWTEGQTVEHVLLAHPTPDHRDGYRTARDAAVTDAARQMGERPGTVGYASIDRDGTWSVFEEILTPRQLIAFAHPAPRPASGDSDTLGA
jgi:hypothetical protein